jgi:uncharacterized protein
MAAAQEGHHDVVRALLVAKADVNAKMDDGTTALMMASQKDDKEVVQLLKSAGADER